MYGQNRNSSIVKGIAAHKGEATLCYLRSDCNSLMNTGSPFDRLNDSTTQRLVRLGECEALPTSIETKSLMTTSDRVLMKRDFEILHPLSVRIASESVGRKLVDLPLDPFCFARSPDQTGK